MKKSFVAIALLMIFSIGNACTTFLINHNGQILFGRNYDWVSDAGMVCTNLKGLSKTSMKTPDGGSTITWISQYGSITFNQYGKEFPTGGMNEKGLVVELMWLDGTQYPQPDTRPSVGVLQWIQYQLDNCTSIDEVIATDKKIRISATGTTPLHYLVADASGQAATIEFLNGKMVVHKGKDLSFPVLTNTTYDQSVRTYNNTKGGNGSANPDNSQERFTKACNMLQELKSAKKDYPVVNYAFDMLGEVSQGSFTKWSIVYDITNKSIHFKTNRFKEIKQVNFAAFDFDCKSVAKAWNMNQTGSGIVSASFEKFTPELNRRIVETAFEESTDRINIPEKVRNSAWQYSAGIKCQ